MNRQVILLEKTANHIVYINFFVCHVKKYMNIQFQNDRIFPGHSWNLRLKMPPG